MTDDNPHSLHNKSRASGESSTDDTLRAVHAGEVDSSTTTDMRQEAEEAIRRYALQPIKHAPNSDVFSNNATLRIEVDGSHHPITIHPSDEMIIGRRDPMSDHVPEIDLTPHAGYQLGLSRRHAILKRINNHLHVVDQGSRNGTYLNGSRLTPQVAIKLHDGDELRMGKMVLRLYFQSGDST